jgi:ElaB/YqjD/DUF883 family membrane-anchored ribosome-binding protein
MNHMNPQGSTNAGFRGSHGEKDAGRVSEADLAALRDDLNNLKDTVASLVSKTTSDAAKSVRQATSNMAEHVSSMAGDLAEKGSNAASAATNQARTFATEFENMARRNPLGALAGALCIGILIGMMGRRG